MPQDTERQQGAECALSAVHENYLIVYNSHKDPKYSRCNSNVTIHFPPSNSTVCLEVKHISSPAARGSNSSQASDPKALQTYCLKTAHSSISQSSTQFYVFPEGVSSSCIHHINPVECSGTVLNRVWNIKRSLPACGQEETNLLLQVWHCCTSCGSAACTLLGWINLSMVT